MPNTTLEVSSTGGSIRYQPFLLSPATALNGPKLSTTISKTVSPIRCIGTSIGKAGGNLTNLKRLHFVQAQCRLASPSGSFGRLSSRTTRMISVLLVDLG